MLRSIYPKNMDGILYSPQLEASFYSKQYKKEAAFWGQLLKLLE